MSFIQPMMVFLLLAGGLGVALLGSVKVPLARRLEIDEARVGGLVSLFGFTLAPVMFGAGFLTDHVGRQTVLMAGSAVFMTSLLILAGARIYPVALVGVILMSSGWGLMMNVGNVLVPLAFPGTVAQAQNLANVFFGLGAFLTPLIVAMLLLRTSLATVLGLLGVFTFVPGLLALGVDFAVPAGPAIADGSANATALFSDPFLWLCALGMVFYSPLEASVGAWATTYLGEQGFAEKAATTFLSGFWLAYMLARLVAAFTIPASGEGWLILSLAIACVAVMAGIVVGRGRFLAAALVIGAGAALGPIFPTLMALLLGHFPASLHGRAVGIFFAAGSVGWTLIPIAIGAYARRAGVRRAFSIAILAALGLCATAIAIIFGHGR